MLLEIPYNSINKKRIILVSNAWFYINNVNSIGKNKMVSDFDTALLSYVPFMKHILGKYKHRKKKLSRFQNWTLYSISMCRAFFNSILNETDATFLLIDAQKKVKNADKPGAYIETWKKLKPGVQRAWEKIGKFTNDETMNLSEYVDIVDPNEYCRDTEIGWRVIADDYVQYLLSAKQAGVISFDKAVDLYEGYTSIHLIFLPTVCHEMSRREFLRRYTEDNFLRFDKNEINEIHLEGVRTAIDLLKPIPFSVVIADYPELCQAVLNEVTSEEANSDLLGWAIESGIAIPLGQMMRFPELIAKYGV